MRKQITPLSNLFDIKMPRQEELTEVIHMLTLVRNHR